MTTNIDETTIEKFRFHVPAAGEGCWLWRGEFRLDGYGRISVGGRASRERWLAHRLSYAIFNGPLIPGKVIMHACDNRACVNPAHLTQGTHQDNQADMMTKSRNANGNTAKTHCVNGHPLSGANLHIRPSGSRRCRACAAAETRARRARLT